MFFRYHILLLFIVTVTVQNIAATEIVSLGGACRVARSAQYHNLRKIAYPFDWMITSVDALKAAFQDDFAYMFVREEMYERDDKKAVINGYGFVFIHDFPTMLNTETPEDDEIRKVNELVPYWRDSIDIVQAKFNRRLQRLLQLLNNGQPVALVRYDGMDRNIAQQFIALLKRKFPQAKAVLVVVGCTPEFQEPWNLSHVCNVYMDEKDFEVWNGSAWLDVLQAIATMNPQSWSHE